MLWASVSIQNASSDVHRNHWTCLLPHVLTVESTCDPLQHTHTHTHTHVSHARKKVTTNYEIGLPLWSQPFWFWLIPHSMVIVHKTSCHLITFSGFRRVVIDFPPCKDFVTCWKKTVYICVYIIITYSFKSFYIPGVFLMSSMKLCSSFELAHRVDDSEENAVVGTHPQIVWTVLCTSGSEGSAVFGMLAHVVCELYSVQMNLSRTPWLEPVCRSFHATQQLNSCSVYNLMLLRLVQWWWLCRTAACCDWVCQSSVVLAWCWKTRQLDWAGDAMLCS